MSSKQWRSRGRRGLWLAAVAVTLFGARSADASERISLRVGGGSPGGVYVTAARAICSVLRLHGPEDVDVHCTSVKTGGSRENLRRLLDGDFDAAIVQSDVLTEAYNSASDGGPSAARSLRRVADLHREEIYLIAGPNRAVQGWGDLRGKRVNVGLDGSGQRATAKTLLSAFGYGSEDVQTYGAGTLEQLGMLCAHQLDALVVVVGRSSPLIKVASQRCDATLVSMNDGRRAELLTAHPEFVASTVPGGVYPGALEPVETLALQAVLVTREDVPTQTIRALVEALDTGGGEIQSAHKGLRGVKVRNTRRDGSVVPLHAGARDALEDTAR